MNKTYKGKTAVGILKAAYVARTRAGNSDVFVTLPDGRTAVACIGSRCDWVGGRIQDVLVIMDASGTIARLQMSPRAIDLMQELDKMAGELMMASEALTA